MVEKLWKVEDVAEFLRMKKSAVFQAVYYKRIPALKLSRRALRFDPVAIRKWLDEKSSEVRPIPHHTAKIYKPKGGNNGRPRKDAKIDRIVEAVKKEVIG